MRKSYKLSPKREISGEPGVAGSSSEKYLCGISPEELARVAQAMAREMQDKVIITAEHWPRESVGMQNRLSDVCVSSTSDLELVVEQLQARDGGESGWDYTSTV